MLSHEKLQVYGKACHLRDRKTPSGIKALQGWRKRKNWLAATGGSRTRCSRPITSGVFVSEVQIMGETRLVALSSRKPVAELGHQMPRLFPSMLARSTGGGGTGVG